MDSLSIIPFKTFVKDVKKLKKRYKNILDDIEEFKTLLEDNPTVGTWYLGHGLYKIRVKNSDKNQGKSGGYRVITCFIDENHTVYLVKMYDKGEIDNIKTSKLFEIIEDELGMM